VAIPYGGPLAGRGLAVLTRSSLISVVGLVTAQEALPLARRLRRLPAWTPPQRPGPR
jgi:hypothetical protein